MAVGLFLKVASFLAALGGLGSLLGLGREREVARGGRRLGGGGGLWPIPDVLDPDILTFTNELDEWMAQPDGDVSNMPYHLRQVVEALNGTYNSGDYSGNTRQQGNSVDRIFAGDTICGACSFLAKLVVGYMRLGAPVDLMAAVLIKICYVVVYRSMPVCRGIINQDKDRLSWIVRNSDSSSEEVCALLLGDRGCGSFDRTSWNVALPPPLSRRPSSRLAALDIPQGNGEVEEVSLRAPSHYRRVAHRRRRTTTTTTASASTSPKTLLKVLHLTDPHYDPDYTVGSNAVCQAPLCCNRDSGEASKEGDKAGLWGDYRNCDSPKWLLHNMLQHIVTNHPDIDYVMCTGDLVPHHIWKITREGNLEVVKEVSGILRGYFPNIPIYGSIGNHESFPRDSFPPPEVKEVWSRFGSQWLYDTMASHWSDMMGQQAPRSANFGGFYSVLARPGFRIISLNTNYCYRLNWWVLYKPADPGLMLSWLVAELTRAELQGELVHIIGHIPPLYIDCYAQWGHQFDRIVSRFSHVIKGQFYGHSHMDDFRVHYDLSKSQRRPVGVEYISPNNGPFANFNPAYRIFYIDGDHEGTTRDVVDYDTWVMNLTHANTFDAPHWYHLYSARRDLQLPSLRPRHWDALVRRMMSQPHLFHQFRRYQVQDSDSELAKGCDLKCRYETVCSLVDGNRVMPSKCRSLQD